MSLRADATDPSSDATDPSAGSWGPQGYIEGMVDEENERWARQLLVQQFVLSHGCSTRSVSYTEVETLWDEGLIERVSGLSEERLELVDGMTLAEARAALRVKVNLKQVREP